MSVLELKQKVNECQGIEARILAVRKKKSYK